MAKSPFQSFILSAFLLLSADQCIGQSGEIYFINDDQWNYEIAFDEVNDADEAKPAMAALFSIFHAMPVYDPESKSLFIASRLSLTKTMVESIVSEHSLHITLWEKIKKDHHSEIEK